MVARRNTIGYLWRALISSRETQRIEKLVRAATGAAAAECTERIQTLWDGYGQILRVHLVGAVLPSVVVKYVAPPIRSGRESMDRSHGRKLKSYTVERVWYERYAQRCSDACRVPRCLASHEQNGQWLFVLEDLDAAGFAARRRELRDADVRAVLRWLARFHATFLEVKPEGLWNVGTYWHLATRPDELLALRNRSLKDAASRLDSQLNGCRYRTFVHGDAKVDNFCFPPPGGEAHGVAAVDFQYVGGGCGMKDLAYFFDSVWDGGQCGAHADAALDDYFHELRGALEEGRSAVDGASVEATWRGLYPAAWADFYRFLEGWAPGHYGVHAYAERMIEKALRNL